MDETKQESIFEYFSQASMTVVDAGPLRQPIVAFGVKRDKRHHLVWTSISDGYPESTHSNVPAGTLMQQTEAVSFRYKGGE